MYASTISKYLATMVRFQLGSQNMRHPRARTDMALVPEVAICHCGLSCSLMNGVRFGMAEKATGTLDENRSGIRIVEYACVANGRLARHSLAPVQAQQSERERMHVGCSDLSGM